MSTPNWRACLFRSRHPTPLVVAQHCRSRDEPEGDGTGIDRRARLVDVLVQQTFTRGAAILRR